MGLEHSQACILVSLNSSSMSNFFQDARNTIVSGSHFNSHTTNLNITYSAEQQSFLASLKPIDRTGTNYYVQPCMSGTRQWIVDETHTWLNDHNTSNILLLIGSPGAGKSTIALSLVSDLQSISRLGSSFFCKRDDAALSDPAAFWRTVAYDLAQYDSVIADRLVKNLRERRVDPGRADINAHFKYFIEDPLMESLKTGLNVPDSDWERGGERVREGGMGSILRRPVVILDALDECGSNTSQSAQRRVLLNTIIKWSQLHPSFRLIITSRDDRITPSLRNVCHHIVLETGDLVSSDTNSDIQIFFQHRFAEIAAVYPSLPSLWPGTQIIKQLTDHAAGLFIWAETVVRFLEQGPANHQLDLILSGAFRVTGDVINELYLQILRLSFQKATAHMLDVLKRVVGAIVLARTPIHRRDLRHFIGKQEGEATIDFILDKLSSVILARNSDGKVRISHLSFTEFICDSNRCDNAFMVDHNIHSKIMTLACLGIMKTGLRFNICQLETSHIRNIDVCGLADRIEKFIPTHLSYACHFWADHLQRTAFDTVILAELKSCMYFGFLYWLEVLSLLKHGPIVPKALLSVCGWSRVSPYIVIAQDNALALFWFLRLMMTIFTHSQQMP